MHEITASPLAFSYISMGILIQRGSVKIPKGIIIYREMHRNKVHDHADSRIMTFIYQIFQIVRRSISGCRAEKSADLVSPGFIAWMFR